MQRIGETIAMRYQWVLASVSTGLGCAADRAWVTGQPVRCAGRREAGGFDRNDAQQTAGRFFRRRTAEGRTGRGTTRLLVVDQAQGELSNVVLRQ